MRLAYNKLKTYLYNDQYLWSQEGLRSKTKKLLTIITIPLIEFRGISFSVISDVMNSTNIKNGSKFDALFYLRIVHIFPLLFRRHYI